MKVEAAPQQLCQSTRKRQTQACAPVLVAHTGVALAEFFKNARLLIQRNATTGVNHLQQQLLTIYAAVRAQHHLPVIGEFDSVREQVVEHLLEFEPVGD